MSRIQIADDAGYTQMPGAALVKLRNLGPEHRGRVIEVRVAQTGEGQIGHLVDANHYLFEHTVAIRFEGEREGIFADPDAVVQVHAAGLGLAEVAALYGGPA